MPQLDLFAPEPKPETSSKKEDKDVAVVSKDAGENIPAEIGPDATQLSEEVTAAPNAVQQTFIVTKQEETAPVFESADVEQKHQPKKDAIIFEDGKAEPAEAVNAETNIAIENLQEEPKPKEEEKPRRPEAPLVRMLRKDGKPMQKRGRKSFKEMDAQVDLIEIPEDEILFKKQYYLISEVAGWFKVNTSLLRYWETEFDVLKPRKNRKGDRYFRPEDVKNLELIYHLLRDKKYSIDGAKEYIRAHKKKADVQLELTKSLQKFKSFLLELKANLQ